MQFQFVIMFFFKPNMIVTCYERGQSANIQLKY